MGKICSDTDREKEKVPSWRTELPKRGSNRKVAQVRLQKFLASCGLASRRKSEKLIALGRVEVNGKKVTTLGTKIDPERDVVTVDGEVVSWRQNPKMYILLYKPRHVLSTCSDRFGRRKVIDIIPFSGVSLYPVGRLDYDAEGLIILTNDGEFAYRVTHPKFEVPKTYHARVLGVPDGKDLASLRRGIVLEDGPTSPAKVKLLRVTPGGAVVEITIHEGRKRQIKRMMKAIGHPVIELKRVAIGNISLEGLRPGEFRHLRADEIRDLLRGQGEGGLRDTRVQNP